MKINCHTGGRARQGIALVITLIMLSVTLVMAIAFLALARRERNSVSTTTDTTTAKLAADSALAAAQAQVMANILSTANFRSSSNALYSYGLLVSTNYYNSIGFVKGVANPTNVNFFAYNSPLTPAPYLNQADFMQNVANLQFLPRVPVFIQTNNAGSNEFRFYLDLNHNGAFDDTGDSVSSVDANGHTNGTAYAVGDPQWVGVLARPDAVHSADNLFVSRYAFIAVPIGNGLDINAIHNQAENTETFNNGLNPVTDGFFRNEGVGSWELNLAAFLADLNNNAWNPPTTENPANNPYFYGRSGVNANRGVAFEDAFSILTNRYDGSYNSLAIPGRNYDALVYSNIDAYVVGPLMTTTTLPRNSAPGNSHWVGSDNTNHFYNLPSDLYNPAESSANFVAHLTAATSGYGAANPSTYDRYTYYRLLSQMGTDSDPDDGKMNLNFRNIVNGTVVPGMETNAIRWAALDFFANAADRMLRMYSTNWFYAGPTNYLETYYWEFPNNYKYFYVDNNGNQIAYSPIGFGLTNVSNSPYLGWTNVPPTLCITNIPVFVNGQFVYSPAVNRVLQMAANLYDATSTNFYPSVFRPIFKHDNLGNVFIMGYTNLYTFAFGTNTVDARAGANDPQLFLPVDVTQITGAGTMLGRTSAPIYTNIYGVPWIIGAKKNLPAFNQFSMINNVQAERLLQLGRKQQPDGSWGQVYTNHMYLMTISNLMSASFWNPYSNNYPTNYPGGLNLAAYVNDTVQLILTNSDHPGIPSSNSFTASFTFNPTVWPGSKWPVQGGGSPQLDSVLANNWTNTFLPVEVYKTGQKVFALPTDPDPFESNNISNDPLPQFGLATTNWLRAMIVDNNQHIVDYAQLRGPTDGTNFTAALSDPNVTTGQIYLWATNAWGSSSIPSWGYVNQMTVSRGEAAPPVSATWNNPTLPSIPGLNSVTAAQDFLNSMFSASSTFTYSINGQAVTYSNSEPVVQAGYTAIRNIFVPYLYQANDPLVHYLASDLNAGNGATWSGTEAVPNGIWAQNNGVVAVPFPAPPTAADIPKSRYQPWGMTAPTSLQSSTYNFQNPYNLAYKDPLVWYPDYWQFPTNIYPTVGWIGRVHRGTPWQTVYLKAHNIVIPGNTYGTNTWAAWTGNRNLYDAANSAPVQDRLLFDLFTTRVNDNAVLGTLSVNQTNLAAWSAVFSGMVVLTNIANLPSFALTYGTPVATSNGWDIIQPAAVSPHLQTLVTNINFVRTGTNVLYGFTNADGVVGSFEHAGDILATPALTEHSPFLNWTNTNSKLMANLQAYGISDAAYEWLPQQMMGLVRGNSTPRYVIYAYGQALRPAPGGVVTGSANFGLVTNYQVVAESAVRAVVSVQAQVNISGFYPVTNYTTRVESYSVLPPD